jgi:hypothetical protein
MEQKLPTTLVRNNHLRVKTCQQTQEILASIACLNRITRSQKPHNQSGNVQVYARFVPFLKQGNLEVDALIGQITNRKAGDAWTQFAP